MIIYNFYYIRKDKKTFWHKIEIDENEIRIYKGQGPHYVTYVTDKKDQRELKVIQYVSKDYIENLVEGFIDEYGIEKTTK